MKRSELRALAEAACLTRLETLALLDRLEAAEALLREFETKEWLPFGELWADRVRAFLAEDTP